MADTTQDTDTVTVSRADLDRVIAHSQPIPELWASPEEQDAYDAALYRIAEALQAGQS